jgi:hypothetical protein
MTTEFAPKPRNSSIAERMVRWVGDNANHILSAGLLLGISEGLNVTNLVNKDPIRKEFELHFGENFGWGGDAMVDLYAESPFNMFGNIKIPELDLSGGIVQSDVVIDGKIVGAGMGIMDRNNDGIIDGTQMKVQDWVDEYGQEGETYYGITKGGLVEYSVVP